MKGPLESPWDLVALPVYWGIVVALTVRDWLFERSSTPSGFGERRR
jgi:hypothetical protein